MFDGQATAKSIAPSDRWPERVIELARAWNDCRDNSGRDRLLSELWLLVNGALSRYVRVHGARYRSVDHDVVQEIAADKSLELLQKLDGHQWNPTDRSPAQLCSFISTLARNGLVDHMREDVRRRRIDLVEEGEFRPDTRRSPNPGQDNPVAVAMERSQFVSAVCECVRTLTRRARTIWFFRVFLEMPSKAIAAHPEVSSQPAAVDMSLARCRKTMSGCIREKGFEPQDMPPGTFAALWEELRWNVPDRIEPTKGRAR